MPFIVGYETLSGPSSGSQVETAAEAIDLYRMLRSAGAGAIRITDQTGKMYGYSELLMLAAPSKPTTPKNRAGA